MSKTQYKFEKSNESELARMMADGRRVVTGMGAHYRKSKEFVLMFGRGKKRGKRDYRKLNNANLLDVQFIPRITNGYPTEKPTELFRRLIDNSTQKGEIVCDPFVGSGACAVAAHGIGRGYVVGDLNMEACEITQRRIREMQGWGDGTPEIERAPRPKQ
jgi:site-specific DNA-methyltransferase (adenine-specific)